MEAKMEQHRAELATALTPRPPAAAITEAELTALHARLEQGSVALSLCAPTHPIYTRFTNLFGASVFEATMRPHPSLEGLHAAELLAADELHSVEDTIADWSEVQASMVDHVVSQGSSFLSRR